MKLDETTQTAKTTKGSLPQEKRTIEKQELLDTTNAINTKGKEKKEKEKKKRKEKKKKKGCARP